MNNLESLIQTIFGSYGHAEVSTTTILSVLAVVLLLSAYEFAVYRLVSHRAFYNREFHISISVIPFFIATIILCLQSSIVITLGTIGALAIVRFRTAVKDPVDMVYILWAVHTGIVCGCQLYEVAVLTSFVVTLVLIGAEYLPIRRKPYVLAAHGDDQLEVALKEALSDIPKAYRIQSRVYGSGGVDIIIELAVKDPSALADKLSAAEHVERFSILTYDAEDMV